MTNRDRTLSETVSEIRFALRDYIEAAYHVGHPTLVDLRRGLLDREGVLYRTPFIESTPKYKSGDCFADLGLPASTTELFQAISHRNGGAPLLFDPPYSHQAQALQAAITEGRSLVITTGTGSGKTESFLMPILAKLAIEAHDSPDSFQTPALRALLLYPMNALVNDQLGRLRALFGSPLVTERFSTWAGRPARFARYTSRTLYPGVRTVRRDSTRLRAIEHFYLSHLETATNPDNDNRLLSHTLVKNLHDKGKWPAKPDLRAWFGKKGTRWTDPTTGEFVRAVTLPDDPELLTRHEVIANPADILVTNYSMLEYMLMRPLERPIFDKTRTWLADNPRRSITIVIDEAHLYRGAAGAEVGMLLRRLRNRFGLDPERVQVICTSASFQDPMQARDFAAALSGKDEADFDVITGDLALFPDSGPGTGADASALAAVDMEGFYPASSEETRRQAIKPFLAYRSIATTQPLSTALYKALHDFRPLRLLVNRTMRSALRLDRLGSEIFPGVENADRALTALIALGSMARRENTGSGLLPCRVHTFLRGLPGLWACADMECTALSPDHRGGPTGRLYGQPRALCTCGGRVFELFTCRNCGTAYFRAYTDDLITPEFLWADPGTDFLSVDGPVTKLKPIDLLLEEPTAHDVEPADLDIPTGRLNPISEGERHRTVFLRDDRTTPVNPDDEDHEGTEPDGEFNLCGVCQRSAQWGSPVQDHQTKGDEPFHAIVTKQLQVQPPTRPFEEFAPLRGRKVLTFSDSRQTAARLAPNLQRHSMKDVLRPITLVGWQELAQDATVSRFLSLESLYLAALIGARRLGVRLRPPLRKTESFDALREVDRTLQANKTLDSADLLALHVRVGQHRPPQTLLRGLMDLVTDNYYGLTSLALASINEQPMLTDHIFALPDIDRVGDSSNKKLALVRLWLSHWASRPGIWFQDTPADWYRARRGVYSHRGVFKGMDRWLGDAATRREFKRWLPTLMDLFCETVGQGHRITARNLTLNTNPGWAYCSFCRATQRPYPDSSQCVVCTRDGVKPVNPDTDSVFSARKSYYRDSSVRALNDDPEQIVAIMAAEHTAQLNAAEPDAVFSRAEEHELLFQDIDIGPRVDGGQNRAAIDVLSCTTTMEVGIDIGTLSGVALRNIPPSRASYQQRAGRAGRRGNTVATVTAFGSADTHDDHFFQNPDAMITGAVDSPVLSLDNKHIARRHLTAFLLQQYHQDRLPDIDPEEQPQLFEVLGTVAAFRNPASPINRDDFEEWLITNREHLCNEAATWLPTQLQTDRASLLGGLVCDTLEDIDAAINDDLTDDLPTEVGPSDEISSGHDEVQPQPGVETAPDFREGRNLLNRLLYRGVLPRYAFPTDVVAMHVFDQERSTNFRHIHQYAPSQGLPLALTQYAPGKEVWIDGKLWTSGAIYSPFRSERFNAWQERRLYFECSVCRYARTESFSSERRGELNDCPACASLQTFGEAKTWIRPPGFAHPVQYAEGASPDDLPARSYATRAKLMSGHSTPGQWQQVTVRIRQHFDRPPLLVTNTGPRSEGYNYCTKCGLTEPTASPKSVTLASHQKPFPHRQSACTGSGTARGLVLGTDFISDVLLMSLTVDPPLTLRPGYLASQTALRTLCEALTAAAARRLEIEPGELQAEYRPALSLGGAEGTEAEIYIYDTLAGGAGFSQQVSFYAKTILTDALGLLESCPANCDRSCYRCLRSFKNRFEHSLLDRHLGASLLRYLIDGSEPTLDPTRIDHATDVLLDDLLRLGHPLGTFRRNAPIDIPGFGHVTAPILAETQNQNIIIAVHGPLTPDHLDDPLLRDVQEFSTTTLVVPVDEIIIRQNLPRATQQVQMHLRST